MTTTRTHIAHGAFRLWHTFSSENLYTAQQGTTRNLMDYNGTNSELYKYQWDYIHNPQAGIVRWLVDDEESEAVIENVVVTWEKDYTFDPKKHYLYSKKNLVFVKMGRMKEKDPTQSLFFKMEDGSVIREYSVVSQYYETDNTERRFEIILPNASEPIPLYLNKYKDYLLSDDLAFIGKEVSRIAGTTIGRYLLPIEDMYILIEGKDFDGEEASRVAAGGFILLEAVQVGKVYKLVKGAKILTKGGLKPTSKIVMHFGKELTNDVIIDLSFQFAINFITESVKHQDYSDDEILALAINSLDVKNAVASGLINYSSFIDAEKIAFNCAKDFFSKINNNKGITIKTMTDGGIDCAIEFCVTLAFGKLGNTSAMKKLFKEFDDEVSQTILSRLEHFTSKDVYDGLETYIKTALKKMNDEKK